MNQIDMDKRDLEFKDLKDQIYKMSKTVLKMIDGVEKALMEKSEKAVDKVLKREDKVDKFDLEIDKLTQRMLALYEPKAKDLRVAMTALGIARDLERMGDHLADIAQEACTMIEVNPTKEYKILPVMLENIKSILEKSLEAYFEMDSTKALEVIKMDDDIDELNKKLINRAMNYFGKEHNMNKYYVSLIYVSRSLERIADLSTNIAEQVYFIEKSERIRHQYNEEDE